MKISHRKRYTKRDKKADKQDEGAEILGDNSVESFGGSQAELEVVAERLFSSQPLPFEALKTPARTVPPTPGTALQQKLESKLEKSLGSHIDIQIDKKMGTFQANMLEAMKALHKNFQKSLQKSKEVEVDQTSASAFKPGPSNKNLDPPSNSNAVEAMEVDYGPALPPRLDSQDGHFDDASGLLSSAVEEPSRIPSTLPKSLHILFNNTMWHRALPQITSLKHPKTFDLPRAGLKNTLTNQSTNLGPDFYPLPQRRISPLSVDTGLLSLLGRPTWIKTTLNMTQTLPFTGR